MTVSCRCARDVKGIAGVWHIVTRTSVTTTFRHPHFSSYTLSSDLSESLCRESSALESDHLKIRLPVGSVRNNFRCLLHHLKHYSSTQCHLLAPSNVSHLYWVSVLELNCAMLIRQSFILCTQPLGDELFHVITVLHALLTTFSTWHGDLDVTIVVLEAYCMYKMLRMFFFIP